MKLQPVFSWQKYEGEAETMQEQFQYQLSQEYTLISNAVNATIDDLSFFGRERQTSFVWINGKPIWTVTVPVVWAGGGLLSTNALPITGAFTVIDMSCVLSNGTLQKPVPYVDIAALANQINISVNGTNVVLTSGVNQSTFLGYVTVYYTK